MPWMMEDVTHDPVTRLREWTRLLAVGNFATLAEREPSHRLHFDGESGRWNPEYGGRPC
jgi:hypothetical protein